MAFSLPGISELASRTVSPGPMRISWSRLAIRARAAIGSPCDPVETSVIRLSGRFLISLRFITRPSGIVR